MGIGAFIAGIIVRCQLPAAGDGEPITCSPRSHEEQKDSSPIGIERNDADLRSDGVSVLAGRLNRLTATFWRLYIRCDLGRRNTWDPPFSLATERLSRLFSVGSSAS